MYIKKKFLFQFFLVTQVISELEVTVLQNMLHFTAIWHVKQLLSPWLLAIAWERIGCHFQATNLLLLPLLRTASGQGQEIQRLILLKVAGPFSGLWYGDGQFLLWAGVMDECSLSDHNICVALAKWHNLSEPQFPHLWNGDITYLVKQFSN